MNRSLIACLLYCKLLSMFLGVLLWWAARPARAALVTPEKLYVSWESFANFNNQRQALEIALSVAACLGEGTRFAVHDWRRSVYSVPPASSDARPARATALDRPRERSLGALLALRGGAGADLPFEMLANTTHLRAAARAHGGVEAVPWSQVPKRARILRLRMSALCRYSCAWVRREVARQCPRGAVCALAPAAPSLAADGRVARAPRLHDLAAEDVDHAGDAYSSVVRPGDGGAFDFYEDDSATAGAAAGANDGAEAEGADGAWTSRTAYYVESSEHVVDDAAVDLTPDAHAEAEHLAAHGPLAKNTTRSPTLPLRRERRAVVVVPLLDWGATEAIFAASTVRPHNVLRPGARIAALAAMLQRHLVAPTDGVAAAAATEAAASDDVGYAAAHISVGEKPSYALYNCRLASLSARAVPGAVPYVRVFTKNGVACQRRGTKGAAAADFLTVADVLRAHAFAPAAGVRRLYVATNAPAAAEIAALRVEAARQGVSLLTLSDLVRRAGPAAGAALEALERDAGDEDAVRLMLDQQLCADARAYVATSVSSWDQYVLRERAAIAGARRDVRAALGGSGAFAAAEAAWRRADAEALADYALYVEHERSWLATFGCANEARPGSTALMIAFMLFSCVAVPFARGAFTRLRLLAGEARKRVKAAASIVFAMAAKSHTHGNLYSAPVVSVRPLDTTRDSALATTLSLAAYLVCVHGALMFLLEPLATTAHLNGARSGPGPASGPNIVAVLAMLRALTLAALAALVVLDVCVRAALWRLLVVGAAALTAVALYAFSHIGMSAEDFALARAPLPTLATLLACAVAGAALVAVLVGVGARRGAFAERRARARTSLETSVRPPRVRPRAAALVAGPATLALALRLCYVTEQWRVDDVLDLARAVLEVLAVAQAGAVLVRHEDADADADERAAGADGSTLVTLGEIEGTGAQFDRRRSELESDAGLERERHYNASTRGLAGTSASPLRIERG